jgi:hypothetical protein
MHDLPEIRIRSIFDAGTPTSYLNKFYTVPALYLQTDETAEKLEDYHTKIKIATLTIREKQTSV